MSDFIKGGVGSGIKGHRTYRTREEILGAIKDRKFLLERIQTEGTNLAKWKKGLSESTDPEEIHNFKGLIYRAEWRIKGDKSILSEKNSLLNEISIKRMKRVIRTAKVDFTFKSAKNINPVKRDAVKNTLKNMPIVFRESVKEIKLYKKKGKVITIGEKSFVSAALWYNSIKTIKIFQVNDVTETELSRVVAHELGHALFDNLGEKAKEGNSSLINALQDFIDASHEEGGATPYSDSFLQNKLKTFTTENFAEFTSDAYAKVPQGFSKNFPKSHKAFLKIIEMVGD